MQMQTHEQFERSSEFDWRVKNLEKQMAGFALKYGVINPAVVPMTAVLSQLLDLVKEIHDAKT